MRKVFATSDSHFSHLNIIKYCNRPWPTVDLMNSAIIEKWNETIGEDDIVIFLGDFLFCRKGDAKDTTERFAAALNGHKIIVKGNHDYKNFRYTEAGFLKEAYQECSFGSVCFCHNPYDLKENCNFFRHVYYGHVHNSLIKNPPRNSTNVCLDANDFTPIDITNQLSQDELFLIRTTINLD